MKKNLVFTHIIAMIALLMMASCGNGSSKSDERSFEAEILSQLSDIEKSSKLSDKESSSKLSDEELKSIIDNNDFRKACELKEFLTAYKIVDKLKEFTSERKVKADKEAQAAEKGYSYAIGYVSKYKEAQKVSDEAERYVILQESMFVLESEGVNGLMRIVGIAKEHNSEDWLYPELLDVAKKIGDSDLAERLQNMINLENSKDQKVKKGPQNKRNRG